MSKHVIDSLNQTMWFGKHKGHLIRWIIDNDPSYILWLEDKTDIFISEYIFTMAQEKFDDQTYGDDEW